MLTRGIKYLDSFEQTKKNVKIYFLSHKDLFSGKWNYRIEKIQSLYLLRMKSASAQQAEQVIPTGQIQIKVLTTLWMTSSWI